MALSFSETNSISTKNFDPVIKQQEYQKSAFYAKAKSIKHVVKGGTEIAWTIRYTGYNKANAVDPDTQTIYRRIQTRTLAQDDWKFYENDTMMTWAERVKHKGKPQQVKLMADKIKELHDDFENKWCEDVYTANDNGLGLTPLATIVDSATTYGGISVSDAANWAAQEDGSTTALALYGAGSISYMVNQATFGDMKPTLHLTTRDLFSTFESLLETSKRYEDKETANAGFTNLKFHGAPVISDYFCPTGDWYGLCMESLYVVYDGDFNFVVSPWQSLEQGGFPYNLIKTIGWVGNLKCTTRKCNFKMTALDYTE